MLSEPSAAKWYRAALAYSAVVWIAAAFVLTRIVMTLIDANTGTHNTLVPWLYQEPAFALIAVSVGVFLLARTKWMRLGLWISSAAAIYLAATSFLLLQFISVRGAYYLHRGLNVVEMSFDAAWALFVLPTVVLAVVFVIGSLRLPRASRVV